MKVNKATSRLVNQMSLKTKNVGSENRDETNVECIIHRMAGSEEKKWE